MVRAIFFCLIGYTRWDRQSLDIVENARMMRFIAPDRIRKRVREWGAGEFDSRYNEALLAYIRLSGLMHAAITSMRSPRSVFSSASCSYRPKRAKSSHRKSTM